MSSTVPPRTEEKIFWSSSDLVVFEITTANLEATEANVVPIGRCTATFTVTVGTVSQTVIVRIT